MMENVAGCQLRVMYSGHWHSVDVISTFMCVQRDVYECTCLSPFHLIGEVIADCWSINITMILLESKIC